MAGRVVWGVFFFNFFVPKGPLAFSFFDPYRTNGRGIEFFPIKVLTSDIARLSLPPVEKSTVLICLGIVAVYTINSVSSTSNQFTTCIYGQMLIWPHWIK